MRIWPGTIVGRTILVLLLGLGFSHLISLAFYSGDRDSTFASGRGRQAAEYAADLVSEMEQAPPAERPGVLRAYHAPGLRLSWTPDRPQVAEDDDGWRAGLVRATLLEHLEGFDSERIRIAFGEAGETAFAPGMGPGPGMGMHMMGRMHGRYAGRFLKVSLQLDDGSWLNLVSPFARPEAIWSSRFFLPIVLILVVVVALSVWAVRRSTQPLALFAAAAGRLGRDVNAPPLPEEGPREVRRATAAFNEMQRRLQDFVRGRTRMLAAISHDLRTPITRLRLRAELVGDEEQRKKMLADLDEMEAMIAATLSFARDADDGEPRKPLDLAALLESLCADAADAGQKVSFEGETKFAFTGRPLALKRAFDNLIGNAVAYGAAARVALKASPEGGTVTVDDDGPGIPDGEMERVFQPFYRLEGSRSRQTGGAGLGLAVVRSVVSAHGGEVRLANRDAGGLRVTVTLPAD